MHVELIQNAALLVALFGLYSLLSRLRQRYELWGKICLGLLFGGISIAGMMMPFHYAPGIIYDGRSIALSLAGLFGGGTCVAIAALIAGAYRTFLGGPGIWAGLATIAATSLLGLFFRRKSENHPEQYGPLLIYGIGIVAHIAMLACQLLLPWPVGLTVIKNIWLPVMLIFPATTVLLGLLLRNEEQRLVTQRNLAENQKLLSTSQAIGNLGSWEYDLDQEKLTWSEQTYRIFGVDPEKFAVTYETFLACVHPDDREAVDSAYTRSAQKGRDGYEIEHRIVRQDTGEIRVVQEKCEQHKDTAGRIVKSIGMVQDITEKKNTEEKLRISETKFRSLFSGMTEGVYLHEIVYNKNGEAVDYRIIDANPASEGILNIKQEDAIGKLATELYGTKEAPYLDIYARVAETGKGLIFEVYFPPTKKHFYISTYCPERGKFATIFTDITERKRTEEALRRLNEELELRVAERTRELEASNRMLEDFAYSVSHDLKAPLRAISGFAEIISRRYAESLNEEARHYFENIVQAAGQMEALIADLLKYARLGKEAMPPAAVSLTEVIGEIISELEAAGATKEAEVVIDPNLPVVEGNATLLKQVFLNLMDNALKYRRKATSHRAEIKGSVDGRWAIVEVADNGIGIVPEYHDKIFSIFQRLHGQDAYPGTGIGLAIVKKAVNLMDGTVEVASEEGQGSLFRVKLEVASGK